MLIIYTPDGADRQEFVFRPRELIAVETEAIEEVGGESWDSFDEFARKFHADNRKALRAALWIMLRRQDPGLRFVDLGGIRTNQEVSWLYEPEEIARIRAEIENDEDLTEAERRDLLADLPEGEPEKVGKGEPGDTPIDSPSPPPDSEPSPNS